MTMNWEQELIKKAEDKRERKAKKRLTDALAGGWNSLARCVAGGKPPIPPPDELDDFIEESNE
jgi:hypothetical protein